MSPQKPAIESDDERIADRRTSEHGGTQFGLRDFVFPRARRPHAMVDLLRPINDIRLAREYYGRILDLSQRLVGCTGLALSFQG